MKIIIHSLDELNELVSVLSPAYLRTFNAGLGPSFRAADIARDVRTGATGITQLISDEVVRMAGNAAAEYRERDIEGTRRQLAEGKISEAFAAEQLAAYAAEPTTDESVDRGLDADGVAHSTDWHSDPPKINADGRWKARRGRDNDAYKAWLLEQAVQDAEAAVAADAEPVATETHALPQDEQSEGAFRAAASRETASAETNEMTDKLIAEVRAAMDVDLAALVEASQEAALDASDSHMDLIKACQVFISEYGHPAYNALKAAVAPLEGAENGKAVPQFTPAERRLMRACIENYPKA
jgi:hypothetical protein